MYTLLYGLYQQWTRQEEYRILVVGLDRAGKTVLLERVQSMLGNARTPFRAPVRYTATVGQNCKRARTLLGPLIRAAQREPWAVVRVTLSDGTRLTWWDMGGEPALHGLWRSYYAECHAVVFVLGSAADAKRLRAAVAVLGACCAVWACTPSRCQSCA